jgi:hypothetical protein
VISMKHPALEPALGIAAGAFRLLYSGEVVLPSAQQIAAKMLDLLHLQLVSQIRGILRSAF